MLAKPTETLHLFIAESTLEEIWNSLLEQIPLSLLINLCLQSYLKYWVVDLSLALTLLEAYFEYYL